MNDWYFKTKKVRTRDESQDMCLVRRVGGLIGIAGLGELRGGGGEDGGGGGGQRLSILDEDSCLVGCSVGCLVEI